VVRTSISTDLNQSISEERDTGLKVLLEIRATKLLGSFSTVSAAWRLASNLVDPVPVAKGTRSPLTAHYKTIKYHSRRVKSWK
jgi:hypothetical protein